MTGADLIGHVESSCGTGLDLSEGLCESEGSLTSKELSMIVGLFAIFVSLCAQAKLATNGDLPYVIEFDHTEINVEADGQSTLTREVMIRINNDQGREAQSVQSLSFNSRAQRFKILQAETLNGPPGKVVHSPVPKGDIEIKEVGEMSQAFDSLKSAGLSFPKVGVGSRIHMKYELKNVEVPIKGFWSAGFSVSGENIEDFKLHIVSKIALYDNVRDDQNRFAHKMTKLKSGGSEFALQSKSPLFTIPVQEESPFFRPDRVPSVSVSSLPDWTHYGSTLIPIHESILSKTLPLLLKEIRDQAEVAKTPVERIQAVAAGIAQSFRYFGDWRRRHGGYLPRTLNEISESRYGDCKDLAMVATAIFRSLGYKSNLTWIYRGEMSPPKGAYEFPVDTSFNHAISRVEVDGKVYFVDATNPVAYAQGVYADIADRPAFVLYADGGKLEHTPALQPKDSSFTSHLAYEFQSDGSMVASGTVALAGRQAIGLTARAFYAPVEAVNYDIIRSIANNGKVLDSMVGDFDRGSRIVKDVSIPVKFRLSESGLTTSAGIGYPLFRDDSVGRLLVDVKDRISDLYIENPNITKTTIDLLNVRRVGDVSLDCSFKTDYLEAARKVSDLKNGVSIEDTVIVKQAIVPSSVLQSAEFAKFQASLRTCFNRAAVILQKR
jgi:hypothetical protein